MERLTRIASRTAALALLVSIGFGIYFGFIAPYSDYIAELKARLEQQQLLIARLQRVAAQEMRLSELEMRAKASARSASFISGPSDAIITANLQSRVAKLASDSGVRVRTTRALPERERNGLRMLGIQVQLAADIEQVQRIIHAIESTEPLLFIESAQLTAATARHSEDGHAEPLEARLDIFAAVSPPKS